MDSHESLVAKAVARALVAAVGACSLVVLLDAGATYPGFAWSAAGPARDPSALEREVSGPGFAPQEFRLSGNFALEHERVACSGAADVASADGDEALDSSGNGAPTVKAVGDFPGPELISLPGDWLYHRALRF